MPGNVAAFEKLSRVVEKTEELDESLKISTIDLRSLEIDFQRYFYEFPTIFL